MDVKFFHASKISFLVIEVIYIFTKIKIVMKILLLLVPVMIIGLASCKKCYECSKTNVVSVNGIDTLQKFKFDACNSGKEGNGLNNKSAIADYEANGYNCVAK
jgi:hypothetical protein